MKKYISLFLFLIIALTSKEARSQEIDKVVAVIGANVILKSEIENQYAQYLAQGNPADDEIKCYFMQQLLTQKLLSQQAVIDSIEVTEDEVDDNINNRLRYMTSRAGGQERLEQFLNRSLLQYKEEMRPDVREQIIANKMQRKITENIDVTPFEIKRFFESIPTDSLPNFNTEVEVGEIVFYPKLSEQEKKPIYDRLEGIRQEIIDGKDFGTMARLYSQDPGSAADGGEYPFSDRNTWVKEFTKTAFKLKPGEISNVFETEFGYHILEVLERRGEQVRVRHLLRTFSPTPESLEKAKNLADSVHKLVESGKVDFYTAANRFSDDEQSKYNGGMLLNSENVQSRTTFIPVDQLDASIFSALDTLEVGEYSRPSQFTGPDGKTGYRFVFLKSRIPPHQANLEQDYAKLKEAAMDDKVNRIISEWFEARRKTTYIKIDEDYTSCEDLKIWM
ncbi:MAG TPA: peptidylprolyl isomerase [Sphingobacteriaceae bacterium]|nr:peptidylprolyl isomerase [Sphingobacteriaceae bacterium]